MAEQEPVYLHRRRKRDDVPENLGARRLRPLRAAAARAGVGALRRGPGHAARGAAVGARRPAERGLLLCLGALAETTARAVARAATAHAGLGAAAAGRSASRRRRPRPSATPRPAGTTHSVKDALRRVVAADLDRLAPPERARTPPLTGPAAST